MSKTTLHLTTEAQRIVDQILTKSVRLNQSDSEMLTLALNHTINELQKTVNLLKDNKMPKELAGIPATLALLSSLVIINHDLGTLEQFKELIKQLGRTS